MLRKNTKAKSTNIYMNTSITINVNDNTKTNIKPSYNHVGNNIQIINEKLRKIISNKKINDVTKLSQAEQIFMGIENKADNYTYNLMLKLYGGLGEVEKSEWIFEKLVLPSAISSNDEISDAMMLNAYANSKCINSFIINKAEHLYFAMNKNISNHVAQEVMLKLYSRYDDLSQDMIITAKTIFTSILNKTKTHEKYIDKICRNIPDNNNAIEKNNRIKYRDSYSNKLDKLLEYSAKKKLTKEELKQAKELYSTIENPTITIMNIMLNLYVHVETTQKGKLKDTIINEAEYFYLTFKDKADHVSKGTILNIYAHAEEITHHLQYKAEEIYFSIKRVNNIVLMTMLMFYSNMKIITMDILNNVLDIYVRLEKNRYLSTSGKYAVNIATRVLTVFSKTTNLDDTYIQNAKSIYMKTINHGNKDSQDRFLHHLMIKTYAMANNITDTLIEEAENVFYSVRYKDIDLFCSILNVYAHAKAVTDEVLKKAKNIFFFIDLEAIMNYKPHTMKYHKLISIMLDIYANKNDSDAIITRDAEKLYFSIDLMSLTIIYFNRMLKIYANTKIVDDNLLKKIQSLFDNSLCIPNQETISLMIRIYSKPEVSKAQIENAICYFTNTNIKHYNSIVTLISHLHKIMDNEKVNNNNNQNVILHENAIQNINVMQNDLTPILNDKKFYNINRFFLPEAEEISRTHNEFNCDTNKIYDGFRHN